MGARKKCLNGFTQIPNSLISDPGITDSEFRLLVAIQSYDWDRTGCFPGNVGLAIRCGWFYSGTGDPAVSKVKEKLCSIKAKGKVDARYRTARRGSPRTGLKLVSGNSTGRKTGQSTSDQQSKNRPLRLAEKPASSGRESGYEEDTLKQDSDIEEDSVPAPCCGSKRTARRGRLGWADRLEPRTTLDADGQPVVAGCDPKAVEGSYKAVGKVVGALDDDEVIAVGNLIGTYTPQAVGKAARKAGRSGKELTGDALDYIAAAARGIHSDDKKPPAEKRGWIMRAAREEQECGNGRPIDYSDVDGELEV